MSRRKYQNVIDSYIEKINQTSKVCILPDSEAVHYIPRPNIMGLYRANLDLIAIRPNLRQFSDEYLSVLFHELAHASGGLGRLNRIGILRNDLYRSNPFIHAIEEYIAEGASVIIMSRLKQDTEHSRSQSSAYLDLLEKRLVDLGHDFKALRPLISAKIFEAAQYVLNTWVLAPTPSQVEASLIEKMREFNRFY